MEDWRLGRWPRQLLHNLLELGCHGGVESCNCCVELAYSMLHLCYSGMDLFHVSSLLVRQCLHAFLLLQDCTLELSLVEFG